jgi:hypothetical protein
MKTSLVAAALSMIILGTAVGQPQNPPADKTIRFDPVATREEATTVAFAWVNDFSKHGLLNIKQIRVDEVNGKWVAQIVYTEQ